MQLKIKKLEVVKPIFRIEKKIIAKAAKTDKNVKPKKPQKVSC